MNTASNKATPSILIRDLVTIDDLRKVEKVEQEVWVLTDRDVTPMTLLVACKEAGAMLIGAFDKDDLIGFAFGFPGFEHGEVSIHSHMLAVLPRYRDLDLGYKLKLAQRQRALASGLQRMTWTFDPLQSRNAHFNFSKVGALADRYKIDFYGRDSSSVLHQNGTDRLWLTWLLDSERVKKRLALNTREPRPDVPLVVRFIAEDKPARTDLAQAFSQGRALIEIPPDILALEQRTPTLAWEWRLATRWAFTELLKAGFLVTDYFRSARGLHSPGVYLLQRGRFEDVAF